MTCVKSFGSYSIGLLRSHEIIHTVEKLFTCTQCGQSFTRADMLKAHEMVHSGIKAFSCETCGNSFARSSTLNQMYNVRSLGGYEFGLELESVLGKFDKNELQRHFINGISISSTFIVFKLFKLTFAYMFSVISDLKVSNFVDLVHSNPSGRKRGKSKALSQVL